MSSKYDINLPQGILRPIRQDLSSYHPSSSHFKTTPGSTLNYLNIPFAQPPIGNLRWRPPNGPAPSWQGVRQSKMGNIPLQAQGLLPLKAREGMVKSEDCLYINVFKPLNLDKKEEEKLPIMVWVYGGAFVTGYINHARYDFSRLAHETQCIIVSINYRVNIFGFLGSRSLSREDPGPNPLPESMWKNPNLQNKLKEDKDVGIGSGNYGIWDVLAGLEWVQHNLAQFNGDLSNITLFGESAGAILIDYLLKIPKELLPQNFTLFHKVILQSGSVWTVLPRSIESAQSTFDKLLQKSGCSTLEELRSKDGNELREIVEVFKASRPRTEFSYSDSQELKLRCDLDPKDRKLDESSLMGPVWDGLLISKDFRDRILDGNDLEGKYSNCLGKKGCMIGYCVDEGSIFNIQVADPKKLKTHASGFHPDVREELKKIYGVEKVEHPLLAFCVCSAYTGDMLFQIPTQYVMLQLSKTKIPTYAYVHSHRGSIQFLSSTSKSPELLAKLGVSHSSEMDYLFGVSGRESHQYQEPLQHFEERKDLEREFKPEDISQKEDTGFQSNERDMSLEMMKNWGDFARGLKEPFEVLNNGDHETKSPSKLKVKSFGNCPQLGAFSTEAQKALKEDSDPETDLKGTILRLEELNSWKEKVGDCLEMEEKYQFMMKDHGRTIWTSFYGDERMSWEP